MAKTQGKKPEELKEEKSVIAEPVVKVEPVSPDAPKPKHAGGRPTDYRPEYCEQIIEFFSRELTRTLKKTITTKQGAVIEEEFEVPNELPTLGEYCAKLGVVRNTLKNWAKEYPEFLTAYTRAQEMAEDFLVKNAITGRYNPKAFVFIAQNYTGMRDKIEHTGEGGGPLSIIIKGRDDKKSSGSAGSEKP